MKFGKFLFQLLPLCISLTTIIAAQLIDLFLYLCNFGNALSNFALIILFVSGYFKRLLLQINDFLVVINLFFQSVDFIFGFLTHQLHCLFNDFCNSVFLLIINIELSFAQKLRVLS